MAEMTLALSLLDESLKQDWSVPLERPIQRLAQTAAGDPFISQLIQSIPRDAMISGVPSMHSLVSRFDAVEKACRQAALVPEDSGFFGHALAFVTSKLLLRERTPYPGDSAQQIISRCGFFLQGGDLASAVQELDKLEGLPKTLAEDWLLAARTRLVVLQAMDAAKAHMAISSLSL
eukprot:TRINITY_DN3750_c0_g1_i1.p1 TRINITY_DN3750_c0_g1~~TRINITY_DN3750_c0_g1_i1.p1  ORF type:complete len:192 (+),score=75.58 TRINITY_DN3750_c0_g1_i1:50-577(+)